MATWTNRWDRDYKDPHGKPITCSEWYDTHDSAKPFRDRVMKAIHHLHFKSNIWKPVVEDGISALSDYKFTAVQKLRLFVDDVRMLAGMPEIPKDLYNEGLEYRDIFAKNYEYAREEFWLLCWGDW
jgi:hypothetical protein